MVWLICCYLSTVHVHWNSIHRRSSNGICERSSDVQNKCSHNLHSLILPLIKFRTHLLTLLFLILLDNQANTRIISCLPFYQSEKIWKLNFWLEGKINGIHCFTSLHWKISNDSNEWNFWKGSPLFLVEMFSTFRHFTSTKMTESSKCQLPVEYMYILPQVEIYFLVNSTCKQS